MLAGSLQHVAERLLAEGPGALEEFRLTVGRPVLPMLAQSAGSVAEAVDRLGACVVEEKLDGIRVQVHREGGDGTGLHPHPRRHHRPAAGGDGARGGRWTGDRFVLDGEVIALDEDGRPRPFQEVAGRVGSRTDVRSAAAALPLSPVFFDILAVDGEDLLDLPFAERHAALAAAGAGADAGSGAWWSRAAGRGEPAPGGG